MTRQLVWSMNGSLSTLNHYAWITYHSIVPTVVSKMLGPKVAGTSALKLLSLHHSVTQYQEDGATRRVTEHFPVHIPKLLTQTFYSPLYIPIMRLQFTCAYSKKGL